MVIASATSIVDQPGLIIYVHGEERRREAFPGQGRAGHDNQGTATGWLLPSSLTII
jgi:hypothetical protein